MEKVHEVFLNYSDFPINHGRQSWVGERLCIKELA